MTSDPLARFQSQRGARGRVVRQLTSGEVIDAALRTYQLHGLTFLRYTALPSVFCLAAAAFVDAYVLPNFGTTKNADSIAVQTGEVLVTLILAVLVAGPIFLTGLTYGSAIVVKMTSDALDGQEPDATTALASARLSLPRLFWLNLLELLRSTSGILVATGFMLFGSYLTTTTSSDSALAGLVALVGVFGILGGIILFLGIASRRALALPIAVIEGKSGNEAGRRSKDLLKSVPVHSSGYGIVYSVYLLLFIIAMVLFGGIAMALSLLSAEERIGDMFAGSWVKPFLIAALDLIPTYLVLWVLIPVWATSLTIIYYERRVRLEGYDIEALVRGTHEDRASRFNV